jgi:hypothetical protein
MAHYLVTLVIETDPTDPSPAEWDWQTDLDLPNPVTVVACTGIGDDPGDGDVRMLHERMDEIHEVMGKLLG